MPGQTRPGSYRRASRWSPGAGSARSRQRTGAGSGSGAGDAEVPEPETASGDAEDCYRTVHRRRLGAGGLLVDQPVPADGPADHARLGPAAQLAGREALRLRGAPYSVKAFVYPPSSLLLLRPLAPLTHHQLVVGGLVATEVIGTLCVMLTAVAIGARWWGPTAAVSVLLLSLTGAMRGEMPLENLSILGFLALALFFLFVLRGHWIAAAVVIGLSLSIKPLLLTVLIVFLLARKWKALGVARRDPGRAERVGLAILPAPGQIFSKLPSLFNRTGSGVVYNSAWVDVARTLGLPEGVTILLRVATVVMVLVAMWLAWTRMTDPRLRIITSTSVLLMGAFLAGTFSEYHFMLTLVPLGMTVFIRGLSDALGHRGHRDRMGDGRAGHPRHRFSGSAANANDSVFRAIGMSLLLLTVIVVLARRRRPA